MAVEFGTVGVYEEMGRLLNANEDWLTRAGAKISYSMVFNYLDPVNKAFFVTFDQGRVTETRELDSLDGVTADFVISGQADVWRGILTKTINPTVAMTRGQLKVKGKMAVLLKNMSAFTQVIDTMTAVELV